MQKKKTKTIEVKTKQTDFISNVIPQIDMPISSSRIIFYADHNSFSIKKRKFVPWISSMNLRPYCEKLVFLYITVLKKG